MSFLSLLTQTATITRAGSTVATAAVQLVKPSGTALRDDIGVTRVQMTLIAPWGTNIAERDVVTVGAKSFEVNDVRDPGGRGHHLECDLFGLE